MQGSRPPRGLQALAGDSVPGASLQNSGKDTCWLEPRAAGQCAGSTRTVWFGLSVWVESGMDSVQTYTPAIGHEKGSG